MHLCSFDITNKAMEPPDYLPIYEPHEFIAAIEVRGRFMTTFLDIEYILMNVMAFATPNPQSQIRRYNRIMMKTKQKSARMLLVRSEQF